MSQYDPQKIEELQLVLLKNPRSPVFASLSEAYRKMGLLEEALEVTSKGIKHNPEYVSGLVAHAKILFELKDYPKALKVLHKVHLLKPENILALRLAGHCHMKLRQHREALHSFKKLLIFSPNDEGAITFVKKWEFLDSIQPLDTPKADDWLDDLDWVRDLPNVEQALHIIDSFMNNGDLKVALEVASTANLEWPHSEPLSQRHQLLLKNVEPEARAEASQEWQRLQLKKSIYQRWLQRIERAKEIDAPRGN